MQISFCQVPMKERAYILQCKTVEQEYHTKAVMRWDGNSSHFLKDRIEKTDFCCKERVLDRTGYEKPVVKDV